MVWTQFEDSSDWVAFNPWSSHVHLINAPAHRLWQLVADGKPRTLQALALALMPEGESLTEAALEFTNDTLTFMDQEGLLHQA